ncbi:MAG: EpsG family protein [Cetobacterium sp.]|uniref:EpsG family protein n=2 Tax=Cetobacterium sp. TaxID=2071632 RepID=UPI002FC8F73A
MIFVLGIYTLFLFYTLLFSEDSYERFLLIFPVLILSIYTGTRMNVGGYDYHVYKYFYSLPQSQNPYGYEVLFVILRDTFKMLGINYNIFLLILSFIFNFTIYKLLIKYSELPAFSFLIYISTFYYWHNFTIIRNYISILLFWISLKYILEKKPFHYFGLITLAFLFHKTSFILYPLYFILNLKLNKKTILGILSLALIINPFSYLIFKINITFLGLSERLNRYSYIIEHGNFYEFLELSIFVLALIFVSSNLTEEQNIMFNINILALFIFIAFYRFAIVLRFLEFFRIGIITMIPYLLTKIRNKNTRCITFSIFCLYLTWKYYDTVFAYAIHHYTTWLPFL